MTRILTAIDQSADARPVLETAAALAPLFGAEVEAVHVTEGGEQTPGEVARSLGHELHYLGAGRGVPAVVDELAAAAGREDVAVVALGVGRHRGTLGHVTRELARVCEVPLLLVPSGVETPGAVHRVLVAMRGTAGNARHLRRALVLAAATDLDVVVVHVDDETSIPSFSDQLHYDTEVYAGEFLARYVPGLALDSLVLRIGDPCEEVLAVADEVRPDVLGVGHRPEGLEPGGGGSVEAELVRRSHVPVLLVPLR